MRVNHSIVIPGLNGAKIEVDLSSIKMTKAQRTIVNKMLTAGSISALSEEELNSIKDLKASIGLSAEADGPICRFDLKCVRIDKKGPNIDIEAISAKFK